MDIISHVQQVICFAFHDSRLLMETCQEAKNLRKIVTLFYLDWDYFRVCLYVIYLGGFLVGLLIFRLCIIVLNKRFLNLFSSDTELSLGYIFWNERQNASLYSWIAVLIYQRLLIFVLRNAILTIEVVELSEKLLRQLKYSDLTIVDLVSQ